MRRLLKPLCHTALALAVSTSLAACGGGGGDNAGDNNESLFVAVASDGDVIDGSAASTGATLGRAGDMSSDLARRVLLRFNMPILPLGANVVGARLHFRTGVTASLSSNDLGRMRFVRIDAGASLSGADFGAAELAHDMDADFLVSPENFDLMIGALTLYQSAASASDATLDVRIQYETESDNDSTQDTLEFVMSEHATLEGPRLEVIYELP